MELLGPVYRTQQSPVMSACGEEGGGVTSTCRTAQIIVFIGASFKEATTAYAAALSLSSTL